ncbi:MAG TPA: hypothetical protein VGY49_06130 [Burkholderiaceae bacterium]|jgi:hypothetical protein|nr:hypothetical protein [Burkholderiaceae bacterium]
MHKLLPAGLAFAVALPLSALADTAADIQALKKEIETMRAEYEARLRALEERLRATEGAAAGSVPTAPAPAAAAPAAPVAASSPAASNAFNPSVSLILSGVYTRTSQDPADYAISGVPLPGDVAIGPGSRGFSLAESELALAASVDPWFRGAANIAIEPNDTVSVEEAFVQTTSLGGGLSLKAGRFFSSAGYLNSQHMHTWDFVDNPLAYQAFLGTQYGDDGVQVSWVAPTEQYIELDAEVGRGRGFPGSDTGRNGPGAFALIAHTGGDVGDSNSWRTGLSMLDARATDQQLIATSAAGSRVVNAFTGSTHVWVADAIWKWAPHGNTVYTNFKLQGEYLWSTRSGTLAYDIAGIDRPGAYRAAQSGWYLQAVYQPIRYWRIGVRTEQVDPGSPDYGLNGASLANIDYRPRKNSLMIDFSPSEFSRVRLQFARDRAHEGFADNQLFLQYLMSLGAHGAHAF